jgi:putative spermidine/putrescine transport system ATP-binding protein
MTTTARDQTTTAELTRGLELSAISKVLGGRTIIDDLDLSVEPGELVCLLGPSGCGKTTTLRTIGGFIRADAGSVVIDGRDVGHLPPERRPTAMVFQNYALWPHMTVFDNVGFGLKLRKLGRAEIRRRVEETLELVGLTHHLKSHPAQISGGEQQRVALARALVLEPKVLLLDEPLSNLDAKLRVRVREDIREIQQRLRITTVFVTHDQDEALSVADRIAVMNGGRVEQYAGPDELYRLPRTRFVAEFVGTMNFYQGAASPGTVELGADGVTVPCTSVSGTGADVTVAVRPEDVRLSPDGAGVDVEVVREVPRGHYKEVLASFGAGTVRAFVASDFAQSRAKLTFTRALVYRDDVLVSD